MRKNKRISIKEISSQLNIPRRTLFRIIDSLKTANRIKRVGSEKIRNMGSDRTALKRASLSWLSGLSRRTRSGPAAAQNLDELPGKHHVVEVEGPGEKRGNLLVGEPGDAAPDARYEKRGLVPFARQL